MLRDVAHRFLDARLPTDKLRRLVAERPETVYDGGATAPWDKALWSEIVELGWTGLAIDQEQGGADISLVGIAGIVEEVGRYALPSPLIPTLSASMMLRAAGTEAANRIMTQIASEGTPTGLAITNARGSWEPGDAPLTAVADGDGLILSGSAYFVQDAFKVDVLLVSAKLGNKLLLCGVRTDAKGVHLKQDHIHDLTRDQASVHFDEVRIEPEAIISRDAASVFQATWPRLMVLIAADLCGAAEWLLQTTVEYAKERVQFDRPIGFFQAVKHPLVNAMMKIDEARSLVYHACAELDAGSENAVTAAHMAKSSASDAAAFISDRSIQLHGGIGFTWEHALHIYFKRNMHNQALMGDGVYHRQKLADLVIGPISVI
ncbi:acyl-CoA dehydrogenase [Roseibium hamelinense]|nr:acyl-CoA dehydrogenase family protein [Roseibium hamelinense]MTI42160.1 acyl-CoA dehydrogenase [Roseibium hamelinense]